MKRFVIFSLTLVFIGMQTNAQVHYGLKGGITLDKISGRSFSSSTHPGAHAGVYAEVMLDSTWSFQPELLWNLVNAKTADDFNSVYPDGYNAWNVSLNWISVPLLISYHLSDVWTIMAGPQYSFLVAQTQYVKSSTKEMFKKNDIGLVIGTQFSVGKVRLGARYNFGFSNLNGYDDSDTWKVKGGQFFLGFNLK